MAENLAQKIVTPAEETRRRHEVIHTAMTLVLESANRGEKRELTAHEVEVILRVADDWIAADHKHDSSKHLGEMSPNMDECLGCHVQTIDIKPRIEYLKTRL